MPRNVVAARIVLKPDPRSELVGFPLTVRTPGVWHLAEVTENDTLSDAHACGASTARVEVRHPVREWGVLEPWCPDCEAQAGDAAREQAAREVVGLSYLPLKNPT